MKVAIIGYAQAGKSTFYRAAARGLAKVKSHRFRFQTRGSTPSSPRSNRRSRPLRRWFCTTTWRPPTAPEKRSASGSSTRQEADLLLHVVHGFDNPISPYYAEIDPLRDQENIDVELVLADLQIVENRLERLQKSPPSSSPALPTTLGQFFDRLKPILEDGTPMRAIEMNEDEQTVARNYQFLSLKPMVVAFNVTEAGLSGTPEMDKRIAGSPPRPRLLCGRSYRRGDRATGRYGSA